MQPGGRNEGKNDGSAQGDQVGRRGVPEPISVVRWPICVLTSQHGGYRGNATIPQVWGVAWSLDIWLFSWFLIRHIWIGDETRIIIRVMRTKERKEMKRKVVAGRKGEEKGRREREKEERGEERGKPRPALKPRAVLSQWPLCLPPDPLSPFCPP